MRDRVRAACVQTRAGGVTAADVSPMLSALGAVDLVVLPELCHVPYFPLESSSSVALRAVAMDSELVRGFQELAIFYRCHLVLPLYLVEPAGHYNAAILLDPSGRVVAGRTTRGGRADIYRKVHLCNVTTTKETYFEDEYFGAGDDYVIWDTDLGKISALICYDRHFSEAWRTLEIAGVDIVALPVASSGSEKSFLAEIQTMALQHSVFVLAANRSGSEQLIGARSETVYQGLSCIAAPDGSVLSAADRDSVSVVSADLAADSLAQAREEHDFLRDRRPETYLTELRSADARAADLLA